MSVAAWVDGEPIGSDEVDDRLARLRSRDRAGSLPVADSREGRQLRRWVAQVPVVERLCEHTTAGSCSGPHVAPAPNTTNPPRSLTLEPTRSDAAALGSIVAAAWTNNPAVPTTAALVTRDVAIAPERLRRAAALAATPDGGTAGRPTSCWPRPDWRRSPAGSPAPRTSGSASRRGTSIRATCRSRTTCTNTELSARYSA